MLHNLKKAPLSILLADDEKSNCYFFELALKEQPFPFILNTVQDGEKLMKFLCEHEGDLPDVLFLDLNMPRKNGSECLSEIKHDHKFKNLPVIIYSTMLDEETANELYKMGAHHYVQKVDFVQLKQLMQRVFNTLVTERFKRPGWEKFIIST